MKRIGFALIAGCLLAVGSAAAENPAQLAQQFETGFAEWQRLETESVALRQRLETLDVTHDPGRDDRWWWNPLWRASQENQLQQANQLTLELQAMDAKRRESEARLATLAAALAEATLVSGREDDRIRDAREQADGWRIPRLLAEPEALSRINDPEVSDDLARSRQLSLEIVQRRWHDLGLYLDRRLALLDPLRRQSSPYFIWREQLTCQAAALADGLNALRQRLHTD